MGDSRMLRVEESEILRCLPCPSRCRSMYARASRYDQGLDPDKYRMRGDQRRTHIHLQSMRYSSSMADSFLQSLMTRRVEAVIYLSL